VIAADARDDASLPLGRHPEGIALALHDEHRELHVVELGQSRLLGATGRVDREGKAEDGDSAGLLRRPARDARAG
jgi:hypothetical protein